MNYHLLRNGDTPHVKPMGLTSKPLLNYEKGKFFITDKCMVMWM
jgi:hypothetical protein